MAPTPATTASSWPCRHVTTHLTKREDLGAYNEEYGRYFPTNKPARNTVEVMLNSPELLRPRRAIPCRSKLGLARLLPTQIAGVRAWLGRLALAVTCVIGAGVLSVDEAAGEPGGPLYPVGVIRCCRRT